MAALFSCTKCHKRYPFEELSQGEQLCKDCRNNYPLVKCTYCRAEFEQNSKGSTTSMCAKCAHNVKYYGKPTACENCSVLAAFIGNRCQRCVNSEKKWGPPLVCKQCKLKCAFNRPEKKKMTGKVMCWLCDQAYKRVLAKTRKTQDIVMKTSRSSSSLIDSSSKSNTPTSNGQSIPTSQPALSSASVEGFEGMTVLERLTKLATIGGTSRGNTPPLEAEKLAKAEGDSLLEKPSGTVDKVTSGEDDEKKEDKEKPHKHHHRKRHHHHHHHQHSHSKRRHSKEDDDDSDQAKKAKSEKNAANGGAPAASSSLAPSTLISTGSNASEPGVDAVTSENVILVTQLREQIESIKKQMTAKDQQLLEKDKKISELKAQMYESDKEFRAKVQAMQRSHGIAIETVQIKNRELTRQLATLSKTKKTTEVPTLSLTAS